MSGVSPLAADTSMTSAPAISTKVCSRASNSIVVVVVYFSTVQHHVVSTGILYTYTYIIRDYESSSKICKQNKEIVT